jgi:pimeloyl-ACP methyl ester carboxylesterase
VKANDGIVETNDGVRIHYRQAGRGRPVVLVHGWRQSALAFAKQLDALSAYRRVVAVDLRGHGRSDRPAHGYRIARLATDLETVLSKLELEDATLLGHSMGCAVVWSHHELFGAERVSHIIVVDMPARVADAGLTPADATAVADRLAQLEDGPQLVAALRQTWFTDQVTAADLAGFAEQSATLPRAHSYSLLIDSGLQDWSDVIRRINVPLLAVGSAALATAMTRISELAPKGRLELFTEHQRGSHFMFWENPDRFNAILREFATTQ